MAINMIITNDASRTSTTSMTAQMNITPQVLHGTKET